MPDKQTRGLALVLPLFEIAPTLLTVIFCLSALFYHQLTHYIFYLITAFPEERSEVFVLFSV